MKSTLLSGDTPELGHARHFSIQKKFIYGYRKELAQHSGESVSSYSQTDLVLNPESITYYG